MNIADDVKMTIQPNYEEENHFFVTLEHNSNAITVSLPEPLTLQIMDEAELPMRSVLHDYMIQDDQRMIDLMGKYLDFHPFN